MDRLAPWFSFEGRAPRLAYWRVQLFMTVAGGLLLGAAVALTMMVGQFAAVVALAAAPAVVASAAVGVRRLHDRNRSGLWLIPYTFGPYVAFAAIEAGGLATAPLVAAPLALFALALWAWSWIDLGFLRGTAGANRYGNDPFAPGPQEVFG